MGFQNVKKIVCGQSSKRAHLLYYGGFLLLYSIACLLAAIRFPTEYSPLTNHISNLGGVIDNPIGHRFFNIGIFLCGIWLIPHLQYVHYQLTPGHPKLVKILRYFSVCACIGISMVGVFPEEQVIPHQLFAVIYFIGLQCIINLDLIPLWRLYHSTSKLAENQKIRALLVLILYFYVNLMFLLGIFMPKISGPGFIFQFPFWEWNFLISQFVWMGAITWLIPSNICK